MYTYSLCACVLNVKRYEFRLRLHGRCEKCISHSMFALVQSRNITHLNSSLGEVVTLLNHGCQFTDATALLAQNVLCSGCQDDDFCACGSHSHLNTAVAILGQLTGEELV